MRGKHGVAAAKRREVAELEERAEKAEHRVARLETELTETKAQSERLIVGLRNEVNAARRASVQASAPALTAAEQSIRDLRTQKEELARQLALAKAETATLSKRIRVVTAWINDAFRQVGIEDSEVGKRLGKALREVANTGGVRLLKTEDRRSMSIPK